MIRGQGAFFRSEAWGMGSHLLPGGTGKFRNLWSDKELFPTSAKVGENIGQ
jgi:hypothetical protein